MNEKYIDIIIYETIDNKDINPPLYEYLFQSRGEHEVIFYLNLDNCNSLKEMFFNVIDLTSVSFINFDEYNIIDISYLFYFCYSLISVNFSSFNFENIGYMNSIFSNCLSLKSLDLSNLNAKN